MPDPRTIPAICAACVSDACRYPECGCGSAIGMRSAIEEYRRLGTMTDTTDERLAIVDRWVNQLGIADDDDIRKLLDALDEHDAKEARARVTDEVVEKVACTAYERHLKYGQKNWGDCEEPYREKVRAEVRTILHAVAPMLAPRAAMPAQVTEDMVLRAQRAYLACLPAGYLAAMRRALEAALAAAPRQPAPEPEIGGIGCSDKSAPI